MALDSLFLNSLQIELKRKLRNSKVEKIYQPHSLDIILHLRLNQENYKLLLSAHPQYARIHLTEKDYENPAVPPAFCMLLRKYLENSRLIEVEQPNFERILRLYFQTIYPIDGVSQVILVIEIMGKHSNIILLNRQNNLILGAIKIVNQDINRYREISPGVKYINPPGKNKINPLGMTETQFIAKINSQLLKNDLTQILMDNFVGLSPLLTKEIIQRANLKNQLSASLSSQQLKDLWSAFSLILSASYPEQNLPTLFKKKDQVLDFSLGNLQEFAGSCQETFPSPSLLLDNYYGSKQNQDYLRQKKKIILSVVERELKRCIKKQVLQNKDLAKAEKSEVYKIKGELILANLYQIKKGDCKLKTLNYYEPEAPEIEIELNPLLSPTENAQAYFKKYTKAKNSLFYLQEQLGKAIEEKIYLEGVLVSIQQAEGVKELELIQEELEEENYLHTKQMGKKKKIKNRQALPKPLKFISSEGLEILVGKNNKENDYLTMKLAHSQDLWLHVKDIPGSHVIVKLESKNILPEQTLEEAAHLAAYYSKARNSSQVPVDFTKKKNVKKPSGSKPGMVIYEEHKTIFVTPNQELIQGLSGNTKKQ